MTIEQRRLEDVERALILAFEALLKNDVVLAKQILVEQIEKTYA